MKDGKNCSCAHHTTMHTMFGLFVLIFGISGLLKAMGNISAETFNWIWPSLVTIAALGKLAKNMCKCC